MIAAAVTIIASVGFGFESLLLGFSLFLFAAVGGGATGTIKLESGFLDSSDSSVAVACWIGARTGISPTISGPDGGSAVGLIACGGGTTSCMDFGPI